MAIIWDCIITMQSIFLIVLNLKAHHPSNTKSHTDAAKRKGNFVKTHEMIQRHNKNKNAAYQLEHNDFSVMVCYIFLI
jgi:hypothetical protein